MIDSRTLLILVVILAVGLGMFIGAAILVIERLRAQNLDLKAARKAFTKRGSLLNGTEQHLFHLLKEIFSDVQYQIFTQVHLASLIKVSDKALDYYETLTDLDKSIDFVIADSETLKPLLAIEYNGPEHNQDSRRVRDHFLLKLMKDCTLSYIVLTAADLGNKEKLKQSLFVALHNNPTNEISTVNQSL